MSEYIHVPAGEGRGVKVEAGRRFRAITLQGLQGGDLWVFNADDVREYQSASHTRLHNFRFFPVIGEQFLTNLGNAILTFEEDTSLDGHHDMLMPACYEAWYAKQYNAPGHPSCAGNFALVMKEFGHEGVDVPQPINLFSDFPPAPLTGRIELKEFRSRPGDAVTFRVEMNVYVILSSCPVPFEIYPLFPKGPGPMAIEVFD